MIVPFLFLIVLPLLFSWTASPTSNPVTLFRMYGPVEEFEINHWSESPNREERLAGIEEILCAKGIYLNQLDFDYVSGKWNFVKIILGLQREGKLRPVLE